MLTLRRCFYLMIIWSGVQVSKARQPQHQEAVHTTYISSVSAYVDSQLALIIAFVPETYHPVLLVRLHIWVSRPNSASPRADELYSAIRPSVCEKKPGTRNGLRP